MAAERIARAAALACIVVAIGTGAARAEEKRVVDELLDILRANRQITEQQYRSLKQRAEEERQRDRQQALPTQAPTQPVVAAAPTPTAALPKGAMPLQAYWKDGFNVGTADEAFRMKFGGRIQNDWAVTTSSGGLRQRYPGLEAVETGTEIRRARIDLQGDMWEIVNFRLEYDFATGEAAARDVYIGLQSVPWIQNIRVGHFKEPFSLEELTSNNDITFMERALPHALVPSRNTGLGIFGAELGERLTWSAGVFHLSDDTGAGFGSDDAYDLTGRVTGLPWAPDERRLLHLGLGYSHQFRDQFDLAYSQRPEAHLYPVALVNTGDFATNGVDLVNPEAAVVYGSLSAQAEYMHAFVNQPGTSDANFGGFYAYASWFVTGESRPYRRTDGWFGRVRPQRNFAFDGESWGAWELAARFSRLDLDSAGVSGGVLNDVTAGVNWYLNPNMRVMLNYVRAHRQATGDANIAESRFQVAY
jgi:phosphate-selective porin OprO/OprP